MPPSTDLLPLDLPPAFYWTLAGLLLGQIITLIVVFRLSSRVSRLTWLIENGGAGEASGSSSSRNGSRRTSQRESRSSVSIGENAARRGTRSTGNPAKEEDFSRYDGSHREESTESQEESDERGSAEQGRQFAEFLNEDPARMELTKKEQFEAFRRWRSQKGLNWRGS